MHFVIISQIWSSNQMSESKSNRNLEKFGIIVSIIAGILILINSLKFVVFGTLLTTIRPTTGLILVLWGLLIGSSVFISLLIYRRYKTVGSVMIAVSSSWGVLVMGSYIVPLVGVIASGILICIHISSFERKQVVGLLLVSVIVLLPLLGIINSRARGFHYLTIGDTERKYLLHVPESYESSQSVPLLVALHGGGGDARNMKRSYGFDSVAEDYGFIVVYPDGTGDLPYSLHTWNSGYIDAYASRNNISDVQFIYELIIHLSDEYNINISEIYMTGHSNGAMMTYRFAAEHSGMLAGIAPVSGSVGGKATEDGELYLIPEPEHPVSVVHIHGKLDEQVLYEGGSGEKGFLVGRIDLSANESVAFWVNSNNCSKIPIVEASPRGTIEIWKYTGCLEHKQVLLVTLHDGTHSWTNMSEEVSEERFYGSTLAEMVWNLLLHS